MHIIVIVVIIILPNVLCALSCSFMHMFISPLCSLNIMGAVMFMRLGWATGEAGMIQSLSMLGIATFITILTGLSLSAIATNGDMGGGGSYFSSLRIS